MSPDTDDSTTDMEEEIDEISRIAQRRREEAEKKSGGAKPDWLIDVETSEVGYYFSPVDIPIRYVSPNSLIEGIQSLFGLSLGKVDLSPLVSDVSIDQIREMGQAEQLSRLFKLGGSIKFEDGRFPLKNDFVPIKFVEINYERVLVSVQGVTSIAESVAQETYEFLWRLAGSPRRWDRENAGVLLENYATSTRIDLPSGTSALVDRRVIDSCMSELNDNRLGERVGGVKPRIDASSVTCTVFFDDLILKVSRYDPTSGVASQTNIQFSVTGRSDYGTGRLLVTSELAYDDHVRMVAALLEGL